MNLLPIPGSIAVYRDTAVRVLGYTDTTISYRTPEGENRVTSIGNFLAAAAPAPLPPDTRPLPDPTYVPPKRYDAKRNRTNPLQTRYVEPELYNCHGCGDEFVREDRQRTRCTKDCGRRERGQRRARTTPAPIPGHIKTCTVCQTEFTTTRNATYCGPRCRRNAAATRWREGQKMVNR